MRFFSMLSGLVAFSALATTACNAPTADEPFDAGQDAHEGADQGADQSTLHDAAREMSIVELHDMSASFDATIEVQHDADTLEDAASAALDAIVLAHDAHVPADTSVVVLDAHVTLDASFVPDEGVTFVDAEVEAVDTSVAENDDASAAEDASVADDATVLVDAEVLSDAAVADAAVAIRCVANAPAHGTVNDGESPVSLDFGASANYACDSGYALTGNVPTCGGTTSPGTLSGDEPTCEEISCGVAAPENGSVNGMSGSLSIAFGASATYACDAGYDLAGTTPTCGGTTNPGVLSGAEPTCSHDDTAPGTTTVTATRSLTRRDAVVVAFSMPGDDGATGTAASYEISYRTCSVGASCPIINSDFASATALSGLPSIVTGGTSVSIVADAMPLTSHIVFALRVTDDAGNVSDVSTAELDVSWTTDTSVAGSAAESDFGVALSAGSITGTAHTSLVIGRAGLSTNKGGVRFVYDGGSSTSDITASQVGLGSTASARFGRALSVVSDVDADGYDDILVSAPLVANATCTSGGASTGSVFVFFGGPGGVRGASSPVACDAMDATSDCYVRITPPTSTGICGFGSSVTDLGNASGTVGATRGMFAIGAPDLTVSSTRIGKVFVYRITGDRPNVTVELAETISGDSDDYHFGSCIRGVGDTNGDDIPDLLIGATRRGQATPVAGRAYLLFGGSRFAGSGGAESIVSGGSSPSDGVVPFGNMVAADSFGMNCAAGGDYNSDGYDDFAVSAPGAQKVYVIYGRSDLDARPSMGSPDVIALTHASWAQPGELSSGRDVTGDDVPDLLVGDTNAAYLFSGALLSDSPLVDTFSLPSPIVSTGFPVLLAPNFIDTSVDESAFADIVIGKVAGPILKIYY